MHKKVEKKEQHKTNKTNNTTNKKNRTIHSTSHRQNLSSFPSFPNYVVGGVKNTSVRVGNSERSSSERRSFGDGTRHRVQGEQQRVVVVVFVSRFENCFHRVRHEPTKVKGEERNGLLRVEN
jgi:hypothetical protein